MSRGKPLAVGPTARLPEGISWERLGESSPDALKGTFPYPSLPHPLQSNGGQVFPEMQIDMFPRLGAVRRRFRPARGVPARVPAGHLPAKPSRARRCLARRGRLDQQLLPSVQRHPHPGAARRLAGSADAAAAGGIQPDRRPQDREPSLGVTCFDCHVNGHTTGQFHLNPDDRPQERRFRLDTTSLRGMFNQQIHGSKRSLRSVEDFTEFEHGPPISTAIRSMP